MPSSIYWDTCLFIELLQQTNKKRFEACEELRLRAERKELIIVASTWSIVEVNKLPETGALPEEQSKKILDFFENPYIAMRQLDRPTAELAHRLTREHGLTNQDAVHVATAILAKVPVVYTWDAVKGKRKGLLRHHLKIGNPPLRIEQPPDAGAGTLFPGEPGEPESSESAESAES